MRLRCSPWALAVLLSASAASSAAASTTSERRESAESAPTTSTRRTSRRRPSKPIALGAAFADGLDVEVYAREYNRIMESRRLKTINSENDSLNNAAAAARGLRTASSDESRHGSTLGTKDVHDAVTGPVHGIAHRAVARANRAAAAAAAVRGAAEDNVRSGEKRSLLDLGNGLTIGLDDSYDDELEKILTNNPDDEEAAGDGDRNHLSANNNPVATTSTANDIADAIASTATSSLSPPRISSTSNADPGTSSPLTATNNDRTSARDKLLLEREGGGRGGGESIHHRISGGGALEIFPLPTDPPTSAPTQRPISNTHPTAGGGTSTAGTSSTATTTVPPNGGVQDDLESTFERRCSTITSLSDLKKAIDDATYWSKLIGPAMVRLCPFHISVDDAETKALAPLTINSVGLTIVCDKSDNLHLSQPYTARPRNRIPSTNADHFQTPSEDDSNSCVIEGSGHHLDISADFVTLMGVEFRGSTHGAVRVSSGVKGTSIIGCTFDGNDLSPPPPLPIISEGILLEGGVGGAGDASAVTEEEDASISIGGVIFNREGGHGGGHGHEAMVPNRSVSSGEAGAALNLEAASTATLVASTTFTQNVASTGGAIAAVESELSVYDSLFSSNRATDGDGGAILMIGEDDFRNILHVTQSSWMSNSIAVDHDEKQDEGVDGDDHFHHHHGPIIYSDGLVCDAGSNFACKNGESTESPSGFASFDTIFDAECNGLSNHDTACKTFGHVCEASLGSVQPSDGDLSEDFPNLALEFGGGGGSYPYESSSGVPQVGTGSGGNGFPSPSSGGSLSRVDQGPTFMPTKVPTVPPSLSPTSAAPTTASPTKPMVCGGEMDVETREILLRLAITAITDLDDLIPTGIEFTPQWRAFRWIVDEDEMQVCPGIDKDDKILQRYTAAVLYFSTGGDDWTRCSRHRTSPCIVGGRFLGSNSECVWYGVSCNLSGKISRVDFEDNNLVGTIASELGSFVELTSLALEKGNLQGTIPSSLGQLGKLETLDLDYNRLSGDIPSEMVGAQALKMIDLNDNKLSGGLHYLSQLNNLERLWVHSNSLVGPVPSGFGNLPRLSTLSLYHNGLTGTMPSSICSSRSPNGPLGWLEVDCLEVLCTCCTKCHTSAPTTSPSKSPTPGPTSEPTPHPTFSPTTSPTFSPSAKPTTGRPTVAPTAFPTISMAPTHRCLMEVTLRDALITIELQSVSHPLDLADTTKPQWKAKEWILRYDSMNLCPDDPNLTQRYTMALFYVSTGGNDWKRCSANKSKSSCDRHVRWLHDHECSWYGVACLDDTVDQITLDDNNVVGELPNELSSLSKLRSISLENGGLHGTLPSSIGELQHLVKIDLDYNNITGTLPNSLALASNLLVLDMNNNALTGPIDVVGQVPSLRFVQLHNNMLSGTPPGSLVDLKYLEALELHNNSFVGSIPVEICTNRDVVGGKLKHLRADCAPPNNPQVSCSCCTMCYPLETDAPSIPPPTLRPTALPTIPPTHAPSGLPTVDCNMSPSERLEQIQSILGAVSDPFLLANGQTNQGMAMDWIIFTDEKQVCPGSSTLVQRYVLALFYYNTLGSDWNSCYANSPLCPASNWMSSGHECSWFGVSCDEGDKVTEIKFESNNVAGSLPDEISALSSLKVLSLEKGSLGGTIPSTLGQLHELTVLDLDYNAIGGSIPVEISAATNLQMVDLNDNNLIGNIDVLASLPVLRFIDVHSTGISGTIPPSLGGLSQLEVLVLHSTNLEGAMPIGVCGIPSLVSVQADCHEPVKVECSCCTSCYPVGPTNSPTAAPFSIAESGTVVPVNGTEIFTNDVCNMTRSERELWILASLSFDPEPPVSDSALMLAPSTPQGKAYTWLLDYDPMQLCPSAPNLKQRYILAVLYFATNGDNWFSCYQGSDPLLCVQGNAAAGLGAAYARDPFLSGSNECSWGGIICEDNEVSEIRFETNNLGGILPDEIGSLSSLKALALENGVIIGTIPASIGSLSSLEELDLNKNVLTGSLPQELAQITSLRFLDLDSNMLTGSIAILSSLNNLEYIQLHDNQGLSGQIPSTFGNLKSLVGLFLQSTSLSGSIPLGVCENLITNGGNLHYLEVDCTSISCDCCTNCGDGVTTGGETGSAPVPPTTSFRTEPSPSPPTVITDLAPSMVLCGVEENERVQSIADTLSTSVSNPMDLQKNLSPQGKALNWITHIDPRHICHQPKADLIQRYAAAVFYFSTGGDGWSTCAHNSDPELCPTGEPFLSGSHECGWGGISCTAGKITEIVFENNNLAGSLPNEISAFSSLKVLSLEKGLISGLIPISIGRLSQLEILDLDFNMLSGLLPSELSQLSNLKLLDLNDNDLMGSLDALSGLNNIQFLQLHSTKIGGTVPLAFGNFMGLKALTLQDTFVYGSMPVQVCQLRDPAGGGLEHLYADCSGTSPAMYCPCCTQCFDRAEHASNNDGSSHTSRAGNEPIASPATSQMNAAADGSTSATICGVSKEERARYIKDIIFTYVSNPLTFTDSTTAQSRALDWIIWKDSRQVCHQLATQVIQRYSAVVFYFATLGDEWSTCAQKSDASLCLSGDPFLSESSECEWGGISCEGGLVTELVFEKNNLAGFLPPELSALASLKVISLERGSISGPIPSSIGLLSNLEILDLDYNSISGPIPPEISRLSRLKLLDLNDNDLTGSLDALSGLSSIQFLQIHATKIGGTVPAVFATFHRLMALTLQHTFVFGQMPEAICRLRDINGGNLKHLESNCAGSFPAISCPCCSRCFEREPSDEVAAYRTSVESCSDGTEEERVSAIIAKIARISDATILQNPISPQARARDFILYTDPLFLCSNSPNILQRYSMAVFYYSTGGPGWNYCSADSSKICTETQGKRYLRNSHECEWYGSTCNDEDVITEIRFEQNNLQGMLPEEIGELVELRTLSLEKGQISGVLPDSIQKLWFLEELDLDYNDFRGPLPQLPSGLKALDMNDNPNLTGSLDSLSTLTHLAFIALHETKISGTIPEAMSNLNDLEVLTVHGTNLQGAMPASLCASHFGEGKLEYISADCNPPGLVTGCSCCQCYPRPIVPTPAPQTPVPPTATLPTAAISYTWPTPPPVPDFRQPDPPTRRPRPPPTRRPRPPPTNKPRPPPTRRPRPPPTKAPTRAAQKTSPEPEEEGSLGTTYDGPCEIDDDKRALRITQKIEKYVFDGTEDRMRGRERELSHKSDLPPPATDLALEWLINDDAMRLCPSDKSLIQRFILATFYFSTGGDDWNECGRNDYGRKKNNEGASQCEDGGKWLSPIPECYWYGNKCDNQGSIVQIIMDNNSLRGEIPATLHLLPELKILALEKGYLTGCIPASFGEMVNLKRLDLDYNKLGGPECKFPDLSKLINLEQLDLNDNPDLEGDLMSVRRSQKLLFISIHNTKFSGIVPQVLGSNASKLQVLTFHNTKIQGGVPESICNLLLDKGGKLHHLMASCTMECSCCTECHSDEDEDDDDKKKSGSKSKKSF